MPVRIHKLFFIIFVLCGIATSAYASSDWTVTLKVTGGGIYDYCILGVHAGATDGHDYAWDIPSPPASPNETFIAVYFPHQEWNHVFDTFRQDIKVSNLPKEWVFEVYSNTSGELIIQWPDLKNNIPDKEAVLVDIDGTGEEIDMHASSSFVFGNSGLSRRFIVRISQSIPVPEPPKDLVGKLFTKGKKVEVTLYWKKNRELDIAGYNIYRSTISGSGYQRINYSLVVKPKYKDDQIIMGETYYYVVTAVNTSGGESGYSNEVEVVIDDVVTEGNPHREFRSK